VSSIKTNIHNKHARAHTHTHARTHSAGENIFLTLTLVVEWSNYCASKSYKTKLA